MTDKGERRYIGWIIGEEGGGEDGVTFQLSLN